MIWLSLGVLLFMTVHFVPGVARGFRSAAIERIGENPYKGIFSLLLLLSIALLVAGWRSALPHAVYAPPHWAMPVTSVLMLIAVWLFGAPYQATRIRRYLRHPQLTGVVVWAGGHLLSNGDSRSIVLFGGLGLWALLEIPLISRRDGPWVRPYGAALSVEIRGILISAVIFFVLILLHPYFAGVRLVPR
jgi:uncharacterized membrane protein